MKGRTYFIVMILSWALVVVWGVYWAREGSRMAATQAAFRTEMIERGAQLYAQNCVICHGAVGQGVVGPALAREALQGDPETDRDTYDFLYNTVARGRPGSTTPRWERLPSGEWASFTAMPAWSVEVGGPFNEQALREVVYFLMSGEWQRVSRYIPAARLEGELPPAQGVPEDVQQEAKAIIAQKGCLVCHTIGSVGGSIGPNLSNVGSWGLDHDFLKGWIQNPPTTANRAPVYFSNFAGIGSDGRPSGTRIDYGPTQMPALGLTDEEADIVARYLMGLK
ncbi:MAG TPA: c-type cytochrome [Limnochordales bacterium]